MAETLQVTSLPDVAVPHATVTVIGWPGTAKLVTDCVAPLLFASIVLTVRVYVPFAM